MQQLINNVAHIGWDWGSVKALAVEVSDSNSSDVLSFNNKLAETSMGMLAPIEDTLKFASLEGSHTNQALRCFHAACPHPNETLTEEGRLSISKLRSKDPEFAIAVTQGLTWQIVSASVLDVFPHIAHILQASGNAAGQVAQGEPEIQVMRRVYNAWVTEKTTASAAGFCVDFAKVKSRVLASSTLHADIIPHVYTFILKFSGGQHADLLMETEMFIRHNGVTTRKLGPTVYQSLGLDVRGKSDAVYARIRHALLKLGYMPNETLSKTDVSRLIQTSDSEASQKIKDTESMMTELRASFKQHKVYDRCIHILHMFDIDAVKYLLGRKLTRKYSSVAGLAYDSVIAASTLTGIKMPDLETKLQPDGSMTQDWPSAEHSSTSSVNMIGRVVMRELDDRGLLKNTDVVYAAKGFVVGAHLRRKIEGELRTAELVSFNADGTVTLTYTDQSTSNVSLSDLEGWSVFKPKGETVLDVSHFQAHLSNEFGIHVIKAKITVSLDGILTDHVKSYKALKLMYGKRRTVTVNSALSKGSLVIAPASTKIVIKECPRDQVPSGVAYCGEVKHGVHCWLAQQTTVPNADSRTSGFVSAWWFIDEADEGEDGNMALSYMKVNGVDTLKIPVMKNTKALKEGDVLMLVSGKRRSPAASPKRKGRKIS